MIGRMDNKRKLYPLFLSTAIFRKSTNSAAPASGKAVSSYFARRLNDSFSIPDRLNTWSEETCMNHFLSSTHLSCTYSVAFMFSIFFLARTTTFGVGVLAPDIDFISSLTSFNCNQIRGDALRFWDKSRKFIWTIDEPGEGQMEPLTIKLHILI